MTPELKAIFDKSPGPWRERLTVNGMRHVIDRVGDFVIYDCSEVCAKIVLALANAHQTEPVQERYYVVDDNPTQADVVKKNERGEVYLVVRFTKCFHPNAAAAAECEAARLNAECKPDEGEEQ